MAQPRQSQGAPRRRRALLILAAALLLLVATRTAALAESCAEAADRVAGDSRVLQQADPAGSGAALSGSSVPPATMESRGLDAEPMKPQNSAPALSAERGARVVALLAEARRADEEGRRDDCEDKLRRAQNLLPPG